MAGGSCQSLVGRVTRDTRDPRSLPSALIMRPSLEPHKFRRFSVAEVILHLFSHINLGRPKANRIIPGLLFFSYLYISLTRPKKKKNGGDDPPFSFFEIIEFRFYGFVVFKTEIPGISTEIRRGRTSLLLINK